VDVQRALEADEFGKPRYVRFQPGRRLVVLYDSLAHLTVLRPRRTEQLWLHVAESPLARWVPELGGVLQRFPLDAGLPGLPTAMHGGRLVRYKPGRRAVVHYKGAYGKLRVDARGGAHVAVARELIGRGIRTPAPIEYRPELGMAVYEEARGTPLAQLRGGGLEEWMEPVAEVLGRLHRTWIDLPVHSMEREVKDLQAAAETAAALGADPGRLTDRLAAAMLEVEPRACAIHGSFHDDHVLVGDEGATLLDLDSAALGHPMLDVGHFASYLTAAEEEDARERFLAAYRPDPEALLFEAAALLRWSSLPFRDLVPGWRAAVARRVSLAAERLGDYERRSASSVITAS
jgi:hypothetical protein